MEKTKIYMTTSNRAKLKEETHVNDSTITKALTFVSHSLLGRRVRTLAVNKYKGIIL